MGNKPEILSARSGSTLIMHQIEDIGREIIHSAIKVHKALGPGLLESVYKRCLAYELEKSGLSVRCESAMPVHYEGMELDMGFRADHEAQLLTYLRLSNLNLGFLLNWNVVLMKDGIKRMVNRLNE